MVDMVVYIIFILMLVFVVAYYSSFEYCRYKMAKMLAAGLGGKAVFKLGWSYMSRSYEGLEERVWIVPDDKMAWGSLRSIFLPPMGKLFLWREKNLHFRFYIEPKTSVLLRTLFMDTLKETNFNVPQLDKNLRLRTNNSLETYSYFLAPEKQRALTAFFLEDYTGFEGFTQLKGENDGIIAIMQGITTESISPERIDLFFKYLRSF